MWTPIPHYGYTLVDVLRERARSTPDRAALVFLDDGPTPVTDAELDRGARSIASALLGHADPGDRALILLPPGRAYVAAFLGCLYAGVVAVPQYPPSARRGGGTGLGTAVDAGAAVAVSNAAGTRAVAEGHPELATVPRTWLVVEEVPEAPSVDASWQGPDADALALLQYTSGSTGTPKGVMVRHDNLLHNSAVIARAIGAHPGSRSVSWLPPYHDMGLVGGVLQPLYSGFTGMLMAPMSFLRDPFRWLEAISRYRVGVTTAPDFGYLACTRRISDETAAALDLSCWEHAVVGAEPVRPSTLDAFLAKFEPYGFRRSAFHPCYGLAEATLFVTGGRRGPRVVTLDRAALRSGVAREVEAEGVAPATIRVTGCGRPVSQDRVVVVDPESRQPYADGRVGEILVSGPTVAAGYWGHADAGDEAFSTAVAGLPGDFLRTGDLGFQLDGDLFVTGRAKDLIIVGGRNYSPHELEMTGESAHPGITPGRSAAFSADVDGAERVVLVHEVVRGFPVADAAAVVDAVTSAVTAQHGTAPHEVLLVRPGKVPTTSSGKVRRSRCRELWMAGELAVLRPDGSPPAETAEAEPPDGVAPAVAGVLCRALSLDAGSLTADVPLAGLGMDSLLAVKVAQALRDTFGAAPELAELLGDMTPSGLTEWARTAVPADASVGVVPPAVRQAGSGQEWLWLLDRMGAGPAYTVVGGVRLRGKVDVERLREAVTAVLGSHPVLRTTYALEGGTLLAEVHGEQPVPLPVVDVSEDEGGDAVAVVEELALRGFDLATGPLLRAVLVRSGEQDWTLGVTVHHIAVDGWSLAILLGELGRAYRSRDHAERDAAVSPAEGARPAPDDAGFWRSALRGACAVALPLDRPVTERRSWRGSSGALSVPAELAGKVRVYAARHQATPFMVLLTALMVVLARRTGQTDLVVGTPAARRDAANADRVGLFVNTLPIRIDASGDPTFAELLERVRAACLAAYAHQDMPFETILEEAEILDPPGPRAPLVRVCLTLQSLPFERWQADELTAEPFELPSPGAQFELAVTLTEQPDGALRGHTVHAADLFDEPTIAGVRDQLVALLDAVTSDDERPLLLPIAECVSLERIARLLREHPAVAEATVRAEPAEPVAKLVAELTSTDEQVPDGVLRSFLSAQLPGTAIPSEYRWTTVPPSFELVSLTHPAPTAFVGPRDDVEAKLAAIWCDVIGLPEVSVDAAFFELGGHSLQGARIIARVETTFGVRVRVDDLLSAERTIEKLAVIVRAALDRLEDPDVDRAVAALERLSDEEIAELLEGEGR